MKNYIFKIFFLAVSTGILLSCDGQSKKDSHTTTEESTMPQKDLSHHCDTSQWHEKRDTIVGKWDGVRVDTLVAEPIDTPAIAYDEHDLYDGWHYKWRVRSLSGKINPVILNQTIMVDFVREGDLDGDGADEFGYRTAWPSSNWNFYHVLTYKQKKWMWLVEPVYRHMDHFVEKMNVGEKTVELSNKKGWLNVKYSFMYDTIFCIKDTLVEAKPISIKQEY